MDVRRTQAIVNMRNPEKIRKTKPKIKKSTKPMVPKSIKPKPIKPKSIKPHLRRKTSVAKTKTLVKKSVKKPTVPKQGEETMSEELLVADLDDGSEEETQQPRPSRAGAWSEPHIDQTPAHLDVATERDDVTSFDSRPSSSQASAKTVLTRPSSSHASAKTVVTSLAQVHSNEDCVHSNEFEGHSNEALEMSSEEEVLGGHGSSQSGLPSQEPPTFDSFPIRAPKKPPRSSAVQDGGNVGARMDPGGPIGSGSASISLGRSGAPDIQKDTDADLRKPSLSNTTILDSRRASIAETSEGSRSQTPHSDTRSYRERLRDRIATVKEKASSSVFTTQSRSRLRQKLMKQNSNLSQLSEVLRKEEAQVVAALERHNQIKSKWKTVTRASLEIAQSDEAFDFFTKVWEDDAPPPPPSTLPQSPIERPQSGSNTSSPKVSDPTAPPIEITSDTEDKAKLVAADFLGLRTDEVDWGLTTKWMPALDSVIAGQSDWIYYPSTESVPVENKLSTDLRLEQNEGIFVPERPPVSLRNYNKLQQRLLAENNRKWFGEDGEVRGEPDPLLSHSYRPPLVDTEASSAIDLAFVPAIKFDLLSSQSDVAGAPKKSLPDAKYFLELQVLELQFSHHPLFSREHVLATRLAQLYAKYVHRVSNNVTKRLNQRLSALRSAKHALVNLVQDTEDKSRTNSEAIQKYKSQIREVRDLILHESKLDRDLLAHVLITWRDLKHLRDSQGYVNTGLKLRINQADDSTEEYQLEYETMMNETWNEVLEEALDEYEEEKKLYEAWLDKHRDDDDPLAPEERLEPPQPVDKEALKSDLMREMAQCVRPPSEPRVTVELAQTSVTPESEISDQSELSRRHLLRRTRLWIKVLYNGTELVRSQPVPLSPDFGVTFNQLFTIRILLVPETLSVEIHSEGPAKCHPLAEVYIPIPNTTSTLENSPPERREFSSDQVWLPTGTSGVGSGELMSSGTLQCAAGWMSRGGVVYSVPVELMSKRSTTGLRRMALSSDLAKLREWCDQYQLDPNDPNNAPFFTMLKNSTQDEDMSGSTHSNEFRLNLMSQLCELCPEEVIESSPRLTLLMLRDRGEPEFRGMKPIPLREREIPGDIFKIYEKRLQSAPTPFPLELAPTPSSDRVSPHTQEPVRRWAAQETSLELVRRWGAQALKNIRARVLTECKLAQQTRTLADVISEDHVPDVGTLGLTFVKWLQPDRPLRPKRKERKRVPVQSLGGQEVKVLVSVVRAFDIPVRRDVDALSEEKIAMVPVRPFVEVSFEGRAARTSTAEGAHPTWNQDLLLPLLPASSDFSPGGLQSITSRLHVHLLDEMVVDLIEDESQRENNIHQRLERNWLGSLSIPFSTLYFNSKIEGTFRLFTPPVLMGYDRSGLNTSEEAQQSSPQHSTYLTLFIMVQPPLNPPEPLREQLACSEAPYVEKYLRQFEMDYRERWPHREMKSLVIDVTGKCVCVTRYFRPLTPPNFGDNTPATESLVTRFVSMIPSVSGTVLFPGLFDIWLTNDQILKLLCGDCEDHAVLLMCYYLYLDITCWLLLGQGIPDGSVAFVLIRSKNDEFHIVHPVHGLKYSVHDSFSPLHKVYCLINQENIWVNIQEEEIVKRTRFDVRRSQDWLPVFNRNVATPLGSVQSHSLDYPVTSTLDVNFLQDTLEKHLRHCLSSWRAAHRTIWNRHCIALLRKLMPQLELAAWENAAMLPQLQSALAALQHITASYKVCGFPINMPFTTIAALVEALKATGVHRSENERLEWALAVYIRPFPCHVLSVWVYVATLIRRR